MKGTLINVLSLFLILSVVILVYSISFMQDSNNRKQKEVQFSEDLYVINNALKLGKLYLETSLDYSVYQAMYDVAKNGGWDTKKDNLNIDDNLLKEAVKKKIAANLKKYTEKNYNFLGKIIRLPPYEESGIIIEKESDGSPKIIAKGRENFYFEEKKTASMEKRLVRFEQSSNLEKTYAFRFFSLHEKAKEIMSGLKDCKKEEKTDGDYGITTDPDTTGKQCTVTVKEKDRTFPVYTGTKVSFEPISFNFLVKIS